MFTISAVPILSFQAVKNIKYILAPSCCFYWSLAMFCDNSRYNDIRLIKYIHLFVLATQHNRSFPSERDCFQCEIIYLLRWHSKTFCTLLHTRVSQSLTKSAVFQILWYNRTYKKDVYPLIRNGLKSIT